MSGGIGIPDLGRVVPGLEATGVARRTAKSVVLTGSLSGRPVVVKVLLETAPEWQARFVHEIAVYRAFEQTAPPVRTPALIYADEHSRLLVLERVEGRPLAEKRFPGPVAERDVTAALQTVLAVNGWHGPPGRPTVVAFDYAARIDRSAREGLIKPTDAERLRILLRRQPVAETDFCHGDALLTNFIAGDGGAFLVDWEFAGRYLPGFDLALLWTVLHETPAARRRIEAVIHAGGSARRAAFLVNLILVLAREIRIHRELAPAPERDRILARLEADLADVGVPLLAEAR